jgi:outer membrane protein assembly factor BamB
MTSMRLGRVAVWVGVSLALVLSATAGASVRRSQQRLWPERLVQRQPTGLYSPAVSGGFVYELISRTQRPMRGPYRLERRSLLSGRVSKGPLFAVANISVAAGKIWVFGLTGKQPHLPHLFEVDPRRLTITRTVSLPKPSFTSPTLAPTGRARSAWIGSNRTLRRIDTTTGKTLAQANVPRHLAVWDLALDPNRHHLYAALTSEVRGGSSGVTLLEYDAENGQLLARAAAHPPLSYSLAGAGLTAVPGGVWASFRTGMQGLTIHLGQHALALQPPPNARIARTPPTSLFHWMMSASTVYGGGALWQTTENGLVACLNPETGTVRAREHLPASHEPTLLTVDPIHHRLYGLGGVGLVQITPPKACWR